MTYLLDTSVVCELRKAAPDARVLRWHAGTVPGELYLSVLVAGEVRHGVEHLRQRGDHPQADRLEVWLLRLLANFGDRILAVTAAVAERWGRLNATRPLPVPDALMAATALEHDLVFVTRDITSLETTGARLLNPWLI